MSRLRALFASAWVNWARMVMEKLKSWAALSNFPTTTAAAAGNHVLKIELVLARVESIPQGLKPNSFWSDCGPAKAVPLLQNLIDPLKEPCLRG